MNHLVADLIGMQQEFAGNGDLLLEMICGWRPATARQWSGFPMRWGTFNSRT